ncbi:hypothetical protein CHS0354_039946 [Potamilus streckersoni]|uniref:Protein sleepless n=1 Tax=Potamilus streckersoni TaxID=2493646 RepID=A0AAE0TGU6_9BIVA|nr:hypothetical protein CHS0354_039946 [Potamilus streckersoni]
MKFVVCILSLCLLIPDAVEALIKCYVCDTLGNSEDSKRCGDYFRMNNQDAIDCQGICIKRRGRRVVQDGVEQVEVYRQCYDSLNQQERCFDETYNGISVNSCTCSTDYCNHAEDNQVSIMCISLILSTIVFFFA